jgi:integrating conjugative element protein (TIGR03746 family)
MMRFQNALANARLTIQVLLLTIGLLFVSNLFLILCWHHAQSQLKIFIPPEIPSNGVTLKTETIPPATIFSFAYYIWQNINYWPANGTDDYKHNIESFSAYLTPHFKNELIKDYNERYNQGEIQERLRTLQGVNGSAFNVMDVEFLGHDTWIVHLHLRLTEHMNMNANQVKDTAIDYAIRVVRYDVNSKANVWGLALDGFAEEPQRKTTFV